MTDLPIGTIIIVVAVILAAICAIALCPRYRRPDEP